MRSNSPCSRKIFLYCKVRTNKKENRPLTLKSGDEFCLTFENVMLIFFAERDVRYLAHGTEQDSHCHTKTPFLSVNAYWYLAQEQDTPRITITQKSIELDITILLKSKMLIEIQ